MSRHRRSRYPVPPHPGIGYTVRSGTPVQPADGEITRLLRQSAEGDQAARARLFQLVWPTLRASAAARLRREKPGHSFSASDLVLEAFLRLDGHKTPVNRGELFGTFGTMMRWVLIDRWKMHQAAAHGGGGPAFHSIPTCPCRAKSWQSGSRCTSVWKDWNNNIRAPERSWSCASSAA